MDEETHDSALRSFYAPRAKNTSKCISISTKPQQLYNAVTTYVCRWFWGLPCICTWSY